MRESVLDDERGSDPLPSLVHALRELQVAGDGAGQIDQLRALEQLKSAVSAAQARVAAAFTDSQRAANLAAGVRPERAESGIANQVGLAMRISPYKARRTVGWAKILTTELPATFAALRSGDTSEWRSMIVARETAWLSRGDRAAVDTEIAPALGRLGDRRTETETRKIAYRLDPDGYTTRLRNADKDRHVSLRPVLGGLTRLSALLPLTDGVRAYATLGRDADTHTAAGDERGRGQLMADLLVERITGQDRAAGAPVEIQLVMPAETLLDPQAREAEDADDPTGPSRSDEASPRTGHSCRPPVQPNGTEPSGTEPGHLAGYGPVPARWARELALRAGPRWIRRLYTSPGTGQLVAMDARRRLFTDAQRRFVIARDQSCRTPWCEAPIRHVDHVIPAAAGGPTSLTNAQGLCQACNQAKATPGWRARPGPGGTVTTETPTGHTYRSRAPDLIHPPRSTVEVALSTWLHRLAA